MSLSDDITQNYYLTTASRSHVADRSHYDAAAPGLLRRLGIWLPKDVSAVCLDLACGCGELVYALETQGFSHVSGVDLSKGELEQGRRFVRSPLIESDVIAYLKGLPEGSVDFITAFNFAEHLRKDSLQLLLTEASRALRAGGALMLMVPNAISPFGASTRYWDLTHEWAFTPNNFHQLAPLTGFAPEVEFRECGPVPYGPVSAVRYAAWQMLRAGIAAWFLIEVGNTRGGVYSMDMLVRLHKA